MRIPELPMVAVRSLQSGAVTIGVDGGFTISANRARAVVWLMQVGGVRLK
jgi:hypothetical protein